MGLFQILYLDRVPKSAAVDESVKLAKKYGHAGTAGLVNAVLRNAKREELMQAIESLGEERIADISAKYSHPPWLVELVVEEWGREGALEILRRNNAIPPLTARVNTLRTTRERLLQELKSDGVRANSLAQAEEGIELQDVPGPSSLDAFKRGLLYFQDAASMLAARCLAVEPGQKVLDVCAGPGGKATHLAALMENSGKIYALDFYDHRVALIEENAGRLGANIIEARKQDATGDLAAYHGGMDRVIADVPCSGIGVIRRRLDLKWRLKPERIDELARLQSEILEKAAQCVRPGGILLYCTCTMTRKENDETVRAFLGGHSEFKLDPRLPNCVEKYLTKEGWVRIMPGDENMDGFFIARFKRL
jgi:16S rRNA (cytosine967-C5)-methyltransferase